MSKKLNLRHKNFKYSAFEMAKDSNLLHIKMTINLFVFSSRTAVYNVPLTQFPHWVYEQYDGNCLVEKAHRLLAKLRLFSQSHVVIPREPVALSFWLASNLPFDDKHKLKILQFSCAIRRLRYEICMMEQVTKSI